ncbi:MAG: hypothetical protein K8T89_04040 [Planctomycetes bacterium]|nr:hypothetical protein [Planctomycetota bacterium]
MRIAALLIFLVAACSSKKEQATAPPQTSQSFEKRQRDLPTLPTEKGKKLGTP